jgi:hypothetical protein
MDGAPVILNASDAGGLLACKRRHAVRHAHADSRRGAGFRGLRGAAHATVPAEGAETHVRTTSRAKMKDAYWEDYESRFWGGEYC